jgi:hypothetical protein
MSEANDLIKQRIPRQFLGFLQQPHFKTL